MNKKILLVHPSRGRAERAQKAMNLWIGRADHPSNIRHVIVVDSDDPSISEYLNMGKLSMSDIGIADGDNVVKATNTGAAYLRHRNPGSSILVYMSDDFVCPEHWDTLIRNKFEGVTTPRVLHVRDGIRNDTDRLLTIPIMNTEAYDALGYMWHPAYKSMWVDNDLYETCDKLGFIHKAFDLLFEHHHWVNGKAVKDETYERTEKNFYTGKEVWLRREAKGFDLSIEV